MRGNGDAGGGDGAGKFRQPGPPPSLTAAESQPGPAVSLTQPLKMSLEILPGASAKVAKLFLYNQCICSSKGS